MPAKSVISKMTLTKDKKGNDAKSVTPRTDGEKTYFSIMTSQNSPFLGSTPQRHVNHATYQRHLKTPQKSATVAMPAKTVTKENSAIIAAHATIQAAGNSGISITIR